MIYLTKGADKFRTFQEQGSWFWKIINDRNRREYHGPFPSETEAADHAIGLFRDTTICLTPRPEDSA